jgi:hypothetical protein
VHTLRQILRTCFANAALIYLVASTSLIPVLYRMQASNREFLSNAPRTPTFTEQMLLLLSQLIFATPVILALLNGMAWWTLRTGKKSGRVWAIAASLSLILSSTMLWLTDMYLNSRFPTGHPPFFDWIIGVPTLIGIAGIIAFAPSNSSLVNAQPARIAGDGTHKFVDVIALALQIGGTLWLMNFYTRWGRDRDLPFTHGLESWIQWFIVIVAVTLIHESAHAVVGVALGMKLRAFVVGPFQFRVFEGRWKFAFRPTQILAFSGAAGLTPVNPDQSRWDEVAMIAAGPFSNLLTGAVAAAMAYSAENYAWWRYWEYFALFATVSFVTWIVNLIPFRPDSLYSDGACILQLFRHGPAADFQRALKTVQSTLVSQRRPRDYDIAAIGRAAGYFTTGHQGLLLRLWAAEYMLDQGNLAEASAALAEAECIYRESASEIAVSLHTSFLIKGVILDRSRSYLRDWWHLMEARKRKNLNQDYWLAKSVFHWAEGDISAAHKAWNTGQAYLAKLPDQGTYNYDRDCYTRIKAIIDSPPSELKAATDAEPEAPKMPCFGMLSTNP